MIYNHDRSKRRLSPENGNHGFELVGPSSLSVSPMAQTQIPPMQTRLWLGEAKLPAGISSSVG